MKKCWNGSRNNGGTKGKVARRTGLCRWLPQRNGPWFVHYQENIGWGIAWHDHLDKKCNFASGTDPEWKRQESVLWLARCTHSNSFDISGKSGFKLELLKCFKEIDFFFKGH